MMESRIRKGETQAEVGKRTFQSVSTVSKIEKGTRPVTEENRPIIAAAFDDPAVYFAIEEEATGGVAIPYLNGKHIERGLSAMKELAQREAQEALDRLNDLRFYKPTEFWTDDEKKDAKQAMLETLDAVAALENLVAVGCEKYGFSRREMYQKWRETVKKRGWTE